MQCTPAALRGKVNESVHVCRDHVSSAGMCCRASRKAPCGVPRWDAAGQPGHLVRLSMFGLGYVGAVSAGCLASKGHTIVGVDTNETKVNMFDSGRSPIIEAGVDQLIATAHAQGRLRATMDAAEAIQESEVSLVCVGSPSEANGSLDLGYVRKVCTEIGEALQTVSRHHTVIIRSTVLPGTMRDTVIPLLEESSGRRAGTDFDVCFNPEFLREGT